MPHPWAQRSGRVLYEGHVADYSKLSWTRTAGDAKARPRARKGQGVAKSGASIETRRNVWNGKKGGKIGKNKAKSKAETRIRTWDLSYSVNPKRES
jgi:hypothetical protein